MKSQSDDRQGTVGRPLLALLFVAAGILHFIIPKAYMKIMPPSLPHPLLLIQISGVAEVLGGLGLLIPATRRIAAWGLVALLVAVWPANLYMAAAHLALPGLMGQRWAQWLRVPLQIPLIYWVWLYTRRAQSTSLRKHQ